MHNISKPAFLVFLCALALTACGGGGGGGSDHVFEAGPYSGATVFRPKGEDVGNCLALVRASLETGYSLYVTQQYYTDGSSELILERKLGLGTLAKGPPDTNSLAFSETVMAGGFYGDNELSCEGVRISTVTAEGDRILSLDAELDLTCRQGQGSEGALNCKVLQSGNLQG